MTGLLVLLVISVVSFAAGYSFRAAISRKRRVEYLKFAPYLRASHTSQPSQPPQFLIRQNGNVTPMQQFAANSRRNG